MHSRRGVNCPVQPLACHWDCVFWHNFSSMKPMCSTIGSWQCCLCLEVVSSIPIGSTIIHQFPCGFIGISLCQSIKIKSTNIYIYIMELGIKGLRILRFVEQCLSKPKIWPSIGESADNILSLSHSGMYLWLSWSVLQIWTFLPQVICWTIANLIDTPIPANRHLFNTSTNTLSKKLHFYCLLWAAMFTNKASVWECVCAVDFMYAIEWWLSLMFFQLWIPSAFIHWVNHTSSISMESWYAC